MESAHVNTIRRQIKALVLKAFFSFILEFYEMSKVFYLTSIRTALDKALKLSVDGSLDGHVRPIVERDRGDSIVENEHLSHGSERCLIESSKNSCRINFAFKYEESDLLDKVLGRKLSSFLMKRAETLHILRRVPLNGYSISFLVLPRHVDTPRKKEMITDFIIRFVEVVDKNVNALKLEVNKVSRHVATEFFKQFHNS